MSLNYTKKTLDNFLEPKNIGRIPDADGYAQIGNMVCGDQLDFYIKVEKGIIKDIKFLSFGCASNIATASVLTEKIKGKKISEAKNYSWQKIVDDLGGLPHQKVHCSVMAVQGLQKAIADYEAKQAEAKTNVKPKAKAKPKTKPKASVKPKTKAKPKAVLRAKK